jgi:hypothetical protein
MNNDNLKNWLVEKVMSRDPSIAALLMEKLAMVEDTIDMINRCLRRIVTPKAREMTDIRIYLEDDLPVDEWKKQITKYIIPFLIKHKLPRD